MWPSIIILGLLCVYASAMCRAAGRPMPLPPQPDQQRARRAKIAEEEINDQTHRKTDSAGDTGGMGVVPVPPLAPEPGRETDDLSREITRYAYQALDRAIETKGDE